MARSKYEKSKTILVGNPVPTLLKHPNQHHSRYKSADVRKPGHSPAAAYGK